MKNKQTKIASGALLSIAAASIVAAPVAAEETKQASTDQINENPQPFTPSIFALSEEKESLLFIVGNPNSSSYTFTSTAWNGLSNLKSDLESNQFETSQKSINDVKIEHLLESDIVILSVHSLIDKMSDTQVEMFQNYVHNGGALLLIGDMHATNKYDTDAANNLASIFGIEFLNGLLVDEQYYRENPIAPYVSDFADHPITEGLEQFWVNWGTGIKVTSPAKAIVKSNVGSYLETNTSWNSWGEKWNYSKDSYDIEGPVAVVASSEFGLGRVGAISDMGIFVNDWYSQNQAQALIMNMIGWLKEAELTSNYALEAKYPAASTASEVMAGGSAIRTYILTDSKGVMLKNHTIRYTIDGESKIAKSNNLGEINIITPPLKEIKMHEFVVDVLGLENPIKFNVQVTPRQFEQNWNLTTGIEGKVGVGVGVNAKLGKSNQFKVGADAMIGSGLKSMITMKYLMDGKYYDLVLEPSKSASSELTGSAGITGNVKKIGGLSLVNLEGVAGTEVFGGGNITLKDFNNPENYKYNTTFAMPLMYEILSSAATQNPKVADNQFIQMLMDALEKELEKDLYSTMGSFSKVGISGNANIDLIKNKLAEKQSGFEFGLLSAGAGVTNELYTEMTSKGELINRNILNAEMSADALNVSAKAAVDLNITASGEPIKPLGEIKVEMTEETITKNDKVTQYSYSLMSETDPNGAIVGKNPEDALTTIKYTLDASQIQKFSRVKELEKAFNNEFTLFQNPQNKINQIFASDIVGEKLQYEELKKIEEEYELPLEIGLGFGPKVQLGFELIGTSSVEYASEQGIFETGKGQYITAAYEYDDVVKEQQENLTDVFVSMGEQVGAAFSDLFDLAYELGDGLIGFASDVGLTVADGVIDGVTVSYTFVKDGVTGTAKGIKVGLSKAKNFLGFSIQTENGEAAVLSEMYFLTFNDENNEALFDLGNSTVPLTLGYTDELLASLGLQDKEEGLAIYRWDSEKVTYVRMNSTVNKETNQVTIETPYAGQYILAYNELNAEVQDVKFEQQGNTLTLKTIVKDKFEYVDPSTIFVHVNNEVFDKNSFEYNASTGELQLTLKNMDYYSDVMVQINVQGRLSNTFTHRMLNNNVYLTNEQAQIHENGASFNMSFNAPQDVKRAIIIYSINGGSTEYAALAQQGDSWVAAITDQSNVAQITYKLQFETVANELIETELQTIEAETIKPIELVSDSLIYDYNDPSNALTLTFNHPLSEETLLSDIVVRDEEGNELAVYKTIYRNQLTITPAYEMPAGKITVEIPTGALQANYSSVIKNTEPIQYVYETINQNELAQRTPNQPWTITFSRAVSKFQLDNFVYVTDLYGNRIATKAERLANPKQVQITPINNYNPGIYMLNVSGELKSGRAKLNQETLQLFTITE